MGLAFVLFGIVGVAVWGMVRATGTYSTPWCAEEKGQRKCHLPKGHEGPHQCDDFAGDFSWSADN